MATLTTAILAPLNDQNVSLTGLALNGSLVSDATVTATLLDETGTAVSSFTNVPMIAVGGTPGSYTAFIAGTFTALPGNYILKVKAVGSTGALYFIEQPVNVPFLSATNPMPAGSLTTVAALKQYIGNPPAADRSLDDLYSRLIARFTAYALNVCNRKAFLAQSYTEKYNGNGGFKLSPKYAFASSPITGVTSHTVDGQIILAAPDDVQSGYVFDDYTIYLRGYRYCRGIQNVSTTYNAGLSSITRELEQAALDACSFWLAKRKDFGKMSISANGETVTFDKSDVPDTATVVLKQFTRRK